MLLAGCRILSTECKILPEYAWEFNKQVYTNFGVS
jgi:hypothetical protein